MTLPKEPVPPVINIVLFSNDGFMIVNRYLPLFSARLDQVGDGAQVVVFGRCGVAADTVQDGQFFTAAFACGVYCLLNLIGIGHACGGDDHGLAARVRIRARNHLNCRINTNPSARSIPTQAPLCLASTSICLMLLECGAGRISKS